MTEPEEFRTQEVWVGTNYMVSYPDAMRALRPFVDFYELSPDVLCRESVDSDGRRLVLHEQSLVDALEIMDGLPVVVHGLGLSIGSVCGWNDAYLSVLDTVTEHRSIAWHSEHLAFMEMSLPSGARVHSGIPLPLPFTQEVVDLLSPRVEMLLRRYQVPFLLENTAHYLSTLPKDVDWNEELFLNRLCAQSGCDLLLDLHNLYCNCVNQQTNPFEALRRLDLSHVVEIHLAGGGVYDSFLVDVHSGPVPSAVWSLLAYVIPRAPRLRGIVYELLEESFPELGVAVVQQQLEQVREHLLGGARSCP